MSKFAILGSFVLVALLVASLGPAPAEAPAKKKAKPRGTLVVQVNGLSRGDSPKVIITGPKQNGKKVQRTIRKRGKTALKRLPLGSYKVTSRTVKIAGGKAEPMERSVSVRLSKKEPKRKVTVDYMVLPSNAIVSSTISAGTFHTCAIRESGQAVCWGYNGEGRLGDGTNTNSNVPVNVKGLGDAVKISTGYDHACAIRQSGQAVCWGSNFQGQLGIGSTSPPSKVPVNVQGLGDAKEIAVGSSHSCAIRQSGQAVCWGSNRQGQLGIGSLSPGTDVPVGVLELSDAKEISAAGANTCAIRQSGQAVCWGANDDGQIGDGTKDTRVTPRDVRNLSDAKAISSGTAHTCAIRQSGQALCWGSGRLGALGDGTNTNSTVPVNVQGLSRAIQISVSVEYFSCAIRQSGQAVCWGYNAYGQLGNGKQTLSESLGNVRGLDDAKVISAGSRHACAIRQTERAVCWGRNRAGQLGNGTFTDTDVPVNVRPN